MKIKAQIFVLFLFVTLLIIRAFAPIQVSFSQNVINGINLVFDVTCGSIIVSILTYMMTVSFPLYKNTKQAKSIVKYKLQQLDLLKWTPGDVNGTKKETFLDFMSDYNYDLYFQFIPLDIANSTGMGIIRNWFDDIQRETNEVNFFISYLEIDIFEKLEDIKNNDVFWQINSVDLLYKNKTGNQQITTDHSISIIKSLDSLNKQIKEIMSSI